MNPDLEKLLEIQGFDKKISDLENELKRIDAKENRIIDVVDIKKAQIADANAELEELKKDLNLKEELLADTLETLKKLEVKLNSVSNEKQLQAVNTEIDIAKTNKTVLEEKIEAVKEEIEQKEKGLKELQERYEQLLKTLDEFREKFNKRREEIDKEIKDIEAAKNELLPTINKAVLNKYERINKWAKGTAIVPSRKEACYGCFMKLTPQVVALLKDTDEIVYCPNCGRMLYLDDESQE
ncbi:zinc ribbon domain-containing protein [Hippea jasoniae]|uniref:zinc ribbon domain-containing protein n=1 Tax=Hippea jasoniae TaxID=944479 RepID=UPI0005568745|nr:C4-type zinc ribbon domain-containing protein [Hippea jasoniae]